MRKRLKDKIRESKINDKILKSYYKVYEADSNIILTEIVAYKYEIDNKEFSYFELNKYINDMKRRTKNEDYKTKTSEK